MVSLNKAFKFDGPDTRVVDWRVRNFSCNIHTIEVGLRVLIVNFACYSNSLNLIIRHVITYFRLENVLRERYKKFML